MSHIMGRGRYARETYPRGGGGALASIIQVGYDQVVTTLAQEDINIPAGVSQFFPRNVMGDPLRVTLPAVAPGNFLEVDFRAALLKDEVYYYIRNQVQTLALVTFNGVPPILAPSATVFVIQDGSAGHADDEPTLNDGDQPVFPLVALAAVQIPAGATSAIVQILISTSAALIVSGFWNNQGDATHPELFATLKLTELNGARVTQPGPGTLIATV